MKEYLSFSSDDRDVSYTQPNSYVITLPKRYDNVKSVRLVQATVPNVIPSVGSEEDPDVDKRMTLYFSVTSATTGFQSIIVPEAGSTQYTKDSLAEKVTSLLEAVRVSKFGGKYIRCRYNSTVKAFEFYSDVNFWFKFSDATPENREKPTMRNNLNKKLQVFGFKDYKITYASETFSPSASDTFLIFNPGTGTVTLNRRIRGYTGGDETPNSMIWLYIDEFAPFIRSVNPNVDGYFMRIPIPQELEHGDIYHFDTSLTLPLFREFRELKSFDRLTIKLIDHDGTLLDFGSWQHYFTFEIETYDNPLEMNY